MSDELKPRTRKEQYYEYMATGENAAELKPRSREEQWFEKIAEAGGGGTDIAAIEVTESSNQLVIALQDSEGQTIVESTPVGIQEALVSGENVKTINGQSILGEGNITIADKFPFDSSWITDSTVDTFCACVDSDANAVEGMSFLGGVTFTDFPSASLNNADLVVEVMSGTGTSNKVIHLVLTSGDIAPYRWEYTYWMSGSHTSGWIANVTTSDLADKMDKNNPIGTGSLFMNAKEGTSAWYSATFGQNCTVKADGGFAEGYKTIAAGNYCHTEGNQTYANSNSHAEGWGTYALGSNTHAEGEGSVAKGFQSHAEGGGVAKSFRYVGPNQLYGEYFTENPTTLYHTDDPIRILGISDLYPNYVDSISSGPQSGSYYYCYLNLRYNITVESGTTYVGVVKGHEADGNYSHIEGHNNITYGNNSHVEGLGNESRSRSQHIFGEYNTIDTYGSSDTRGTYVEIVGKGTAANNRSNARTLDWSGNEYIAGNLQAAGLTDGTTTKTMTEILAGSADKMDKQDPTGTGSLSLNRKANTTIGTNSVAVGYNTTASSTYSFAEGDSTKASNSAAHAEGYYTTASGMRSHAEGANTTASGVASHAEGGSSTASGSAAHAEGYSTASKDYAHSEGSSTTASGYASHAEGQNTTASGDDSHAEGKGTTANHKSQHTFGEYNIVDSNVSAADQRGDYIEIVGNGTADNARSNARTLDWSGNEVLAGNITATGFIIPNKDQKQILRANGTSLATYEHCLWGEWTDGISQGGVIAFNLICHTSDDLSDPTNIHDLGEIIMDRGAQGTSDTSYTKFLPATGYYYNGTARGLIIGIYAYYDPNDPLGYDIIIKGIGAPYQDPANPITLSISLDRDTRHSL